MSERNEERTLSLHGWAKYAAFGRHRGRFFEGLIALLVAVVLASGTYTVQHEELAMVTRFGKVIKPEVGPGVRYRFPVIDQAYVHPTNRVPSHHVSNNEGGMLSFTIPSAGSSMFEVDLALEYRIDNLRDYLFASTDPRELVAMLAREELARVTSHDFIDPVSTENRNIIQRYLFDAITSHLESEGVGIELVSLDIVGVREAPQTLLASRNLNDTAPERITT